MTRYPCPYLSGAVELSDEREQHIAEHHPDLLPDHRDRIGHTLADPDQVRRSRRFGNARLFAKWYDNLLQGNTWSWSLSVRINQVNGTGS
jgi:hypothetical protein